ncbi:MAG: hypothetical protein NWE81_04055 [Candidatus Bathyarchaeota archaeon]|nr:hypothetical protein [Candidatus Bathyarchaeota archaeon]
MRRWEDFRRLAMEKKPRSLVYVIAQSIPAKDLTSLKVILPSEGVQYVFVDSAKGDQLRQTGIRVRTDRKGNRFLEDGEVVGFLKGALKQESLQIFSYWTA